LDRERWIQSCECIPPPSANSTTTHTYSGETWDLSKSNDHRHNASLLWMTRDQRLHSNSLGSRRGPNWGARSRLYYCRDHSDTCHHV
jgi:hypothetical protein